jgi:hypothetical protein
MGRNWKKVVCSTYVGCKSQKRGKRMSNRKFRRKERQCLDNSSFEKLPHSPKELTDEWELGGDGKRKSFGHLFKALEHI